MITGVVLARNEEINIVDCLTALRPHVDEIVLVDMESDDRTVELAQPYVSRVLRHSLMRNFDSARNIAVPVARNEWMWFVDADERVPTATGRFVNDLIRNQGNEFEALAIPFRSYCCGRWMRHCGWWPGFTGPRVLKRGHFRWATRIHGGVHVDGREWIVSPDPQISVDHFGIRDVQHYMEKINRYSAAEAENLALEGRQWDWRAAIADMMHELWTTYEKNPGRLDGKRGWIAAWLSGQYRWLAQTKLLDLQAETDDLLDPHAVPADLDDAILSMQDALAHLRARSPQLPLGIVWRAGISNESGYAEEARTFIKGLAQGERPQSLDDRLAWSEEGAGMAEVDKPLFRALYRARRPRNSIVVTHGVPDASRPDVRGAVNVIRTMIETDRLPSQWVSQIDAYDEIWVPSQHVADACRRSWIAPEKIRRIPACLDTNIFTPHGSTFPLPHTNDENFIFLSVLDWVPRKGCQLLLESYCQEFAADEGVQLLLKLSRVHGQSLEQIRRVCDAVLRELGQSLRKRPDIVLLDATLSSQEMASLYRSVDSFVLASHGEGWGRPYMEAMACGLVVIGTAATGNLEFMTEDNSILIPAKQVPVPEEAVRRFPLFAGHRWFQPDAQTLRLSMRRVVDDGDMRSRIGKRAADDIRTQYGLQMGATKLDSAVQEVEQRFAHQHAPPVRGDQVRVVLEGELFAGHSFSNINESLCRQFAEDPSLAISITRRHTGGNVEYPSFAHEIAPYVGRDLPDGPQVIIRHAYPPDWTPPPQGLWVHIQPWEYGHLPKDWIAPLTSEVDEIWAPSEYVRRVYERSGVPREKIHVIPWGIDPLVFTPGAVPLLLETGKTFHFLYVGGTIARKGFDRLLKAYIAEFERDDDVCLVIKDIGAETVYQNASSHREILLAQQDPENPAILYIDRPLTRGQLASLYTACNCLAAPYRGEGFGLPILEAMACGVPPIVPQGGASADFTSEKTAFLLPSEEVEVETEARLCGPLLEQSLRQEDLQEVMRRAVEQRQETLLKGIAASKEVHLKFTLRETASRMSNRLASLASGRRPLRGQTTAAAQFREGNAEVPICTIVVVGNNLERLPDTMAHVRPFVDRLIICFAEPPADTWVEMVNEYGAEVAGSAPLPDEADGGWLLRLDCGEVAKEEELRALPEVLRSLPKDVRAAGARVTVRDPTGKVLQQQTEIRLLRCGDSDQERLFDPAFSRVLNDLSAPSVVVVLELVATPGQVLLS